MHILFTGFVVAVMGVASWMSFTNPFSTKVVAAPAVAVVEGVSARGPASVQERLPAIFEVRCGKSGQSILTTEPRVRLKLKGCKPHQQALDVSNLTNGFTASVFTSQKEASTDFIDLVPGQNTVRIQARDRKAAVSETELLIQWSK